MSDDGPTWPDGDDPTPPPPPPPPTPAPPGISGPRTGDAADIGIRIVARIVDAILLSLVNALLIFPFVLGSILAEDVGAGAAFGVGSGITGFVAGLVSAAISVGYFTVLESYWGATVGKRLFNLRVVGPGDGLPTLEQSFRRNAWLLVSLVPVVGGLVQLGVVIWIIVTVSGSKTNQGVHDDFAGGTRVLRA